MKDYSNKFNFFTAIPTVTIRKDYNGESVTREIEDREILEAMRNHDSYEGESWKLYGERQTGRVTVGEFDSEEAVFDVLHGLMATLAEPRDIIEEQGAAWRGCRAGDVLTDIINQCSNEERF